MNNANWPRWRLLGDLWRLRMPSSERATARELDELNNSRLVLSPEERIRVPNLWAIEFYSPRYLKTLLESLRRFTERRRIGMFEAPDMSEWLRHTRKSGHGWRRTGPFADALRLPVGGRKPKKLPKCN